MTCRVYQSASRVPRVYRCICLYEVFILNYTNTASASSRNNSLSDCLSNTKRISKCKNYISNLYFIGVIKCNSIQLFSFYLYNCNITFGISTDQFRSVLFLISGYANFYLICSINNMVVCNNIAIICYYNTTARSTLRNITLSSIKRITIGSATTDATAADTAAGPPADAPQASPVKRIRRTSGGANQRRAACCRAARRRRGLPMRRPPRKSR